jgi:hypothetical protein
VHVNGRIIIFGGTCSYPFQSAAQSTFCQYAIGTGEWSKLDIVGYHPLGRQYVQAVPYGDHSIIYFGGFNTHEHYFFSDIFILNTNTSHILKLNPYGMGPCPRRCPGMCLINSNLLVCGGIGVNQDEPSPKAIMTYEDTYILPLLSSLKQLCLQTIIDYQLPIDRLPVTMQTLITSFQVTTTDDSVRTEVTE